MRRVSGLPVLTGLVSASLWLFPLLGCPGDPPPPDAAADSDGGRDAGVAVDASGADTATADAAVPDTSGTDTSGIDVTAADATMPDAPAPDQHAPDQGSGTDAGGADDAAGTVPEFPCPPLPPPDLAVENIIQVNTDQVDQLQSIVANAQPYDTILFADGHYHLGGAYLWISSPHVTLRSASRARGAVTLNGDDQSTEIITVAASDVTIADLTIREAHTHPIHVVATSEGHTLNTLIYSVHIVDPREQAIKINSNDDTHFADDGVVACSHIELTDEGRPNVNPTSGGCYTGGVDAHRARGWVIRNNLIEGFWCPTGLAEHAIHLWRGGRDTLVERNLLLNNARGIGFGLASSGEARTYDDDPCPGVSGYVGHYGGVVRNNFIHVNSAALLATDDGFDCGICLWSACGATVVHNTVVSTGDNFSSIEWRFDTSVGIEVRNNIATHPLRERDPVSAVQSGNLEGAPLSLFVDGSGGNLHLAPGASAAIDMGDTLGAGVCDTDIDGQLRNGNPDIGADELD